MASASVASASVASACVASACVAAPITHLVSVEVIKGLISTVGMWTTVAVIWIEAVIDVAVEVVGPVEPRSGSDENAAVEPLGPVVPVWRAVVRSDVVVAIRTNRFCSGPLFRPGRTGSQRDPGASAGSNATLRGPVRRS